MQVRPVRYDNGLPREMRNGEETIAPEYLGTETPTSEKVLWGDGVWRTIYYSKKTISTTTATETTIETIPIPSGSGALITVNIVCRKTGGTEIRANVSVGASATTYNIIVALRGFYA